MANYNSLRGKRYIVKASFKLPENNIKASFSIPAGGGGGTYDYERLRNKPSINDVELIGNKTSEELGLASLGDVSDLTDRVTVNSSDITIIQNTINTFGDIVTYDASDFASANQGALADTAIQPNDNISELVNNVGYITGITSSDIQTALGYIPYSSENPSGFITVSALNGYATENWVNNQGFIKGINGTDVISALGYTPYDNSNPAGYITSASLPTVNNSTITIQKNGSDIESFNLNQSTNKTINITVPTQTSDLTNNSGFITNAVNNLANYYLKSETYTKTEVQNLISGITGITIEVVSELPASGENGVIYLVPKEGASPDIYNEYIWVETDADFELIGNTEIDLTNYVQFTDLATVATSGSYNDLINQPTIPTVGNGTITINQGGTQKGTFTVNQSGNTTIDLDGNITVDSTLSTTSTNPVQNKVITTSLNKKLENTSTGYNSLTVGGISYSSGNTLNVGKGSKAMASWSTALGFSAETRAESAIQLGYGKNYDELTLAVGFVESDTEYEVQNAYNYTLLDGATGLIPDARLSNNIARTTDIGNGTITFTQGGVTKGTITTNQSGNTTIAFDAGGGGGGAVDSVNGQTGVVVLTASDVGALPDSTTIPSKTSDLTNDSGFITGITSSDVITALTYTPYNGATNPNGYITSSALSGYATETWVGQQGYITGITSSDVTTALGYTPYNSSNPNGYITSADLPTVNNATITFTQGGTTKGTITLNQSTNQTIALDAGSSGGGTWGSITGTLSDQTDLQNALNAKLNTSDVTEYTAQEVETLWGSI